MNSKIKKDKFAFNEKNLKKSKEIIAKYPKGREQSAVLSLLDLAQRQNGGWISGAVIEYISQMLEVVPIKIYEIASFYTMFNLKPVGKYHIQVCGTTPCWLRGAEAIIAKCEKLLKIKKGETTEDSQFTLSEVECLGACANAPVVQINDDYYEDLSSETIERIILDLKNGKKITVGSQIGRKSSEPKDNV